MPIHASVFEKFSHQLKRDDTQSAETLVSFVEWIDAGHRGAYLAPRRSGKSRALAAYAAHLLHVDKQTPIVIVSSTKSENDVLRATIATFAVDPADVERIQFFAGRYNKFNADATKRAHVLVDEWTYVDSWAELESGAVGIGTPLTTDGLGSE